MAAALCGIQVLRGQSRPLWIEAHGRQTVKAIAASGHGLLAIGMDEKAHIYPVQSRFWVMLRPAVEARLIAGFSDGGVIVDKKNTLWRWGGGETVVLAGSVPAEVSAIATADGSRIYGIVAGDVRAIRPEAGSEVVCEGRKALDIAAGREGLYILTKEGEIIASQGGCAPVEPRLPDVAGITVWAGRLVAVDKAKQGWVLAGSEWRSLSRPTRHRPSTWAARSEITQARGTDYSLWARDQAGLVYVFSHDEAW